MYSEKEEVVDVLMKNGHMNLLESSWSCFEDGDIPCGVCVPCEHRIHGFKNAGTDDPYLKVRDLV